MNARHPDVIVIGAGVIGLFSAWELADAGLKVLVIERGEPGREASWAGGGILSPLHPWRYPEPVLALSRWSQIAYSRIARKLSEQTGIDPEWTQSRLLILDPVSMTDARVWAQREHAACEILAGSELPRRFPGVGPATTAILLPAVAQVRNPRLLKALAALLRDKGVEILTNSPVERIEVDGRRVNGVRTSREVIGTGRVVLAAGAWSGGLAPSLPVRPVKGQMLLYAPGTLALPAVVLREDSYLIPRRDGRILAGSSVEDCGFDKTPTAEVRQRLEQAARAMFPALAGARLEAHWAGLRPGSPAGVPFICEYPGISGLYLNTGHFRYGLLTAPASARLLADLVLNREPLIDPAAYGLSRTA
jgi:glycine oxidase